MSPKVIPYHIFASASAWTEASITKPMDCSGVSLTLNKSTGGRYAFASGMDEPK